MVAIDILFLTTIACFFLAFIPYITGLCLEKRRHPKSQVAYLIGCIIVIIGVITGLSTIALDTYQEHTTEYVKCERCGSRVPAAEYEIGE